METPNLDRFRSIPWTKSDDSHYRLFTEFGSLRSIANPQEMFRDAMITWAEQQAMTAFDKIPEGSNFSVIEYEPLTAHFDPATKMYSASWSFEVKPID